MIKKSLLGLLALVLFTGGTSFGQAFTPIFPSDLGLGVGAGPVNDTFSVGNLFGLSPGALSLTITNGNVAAGSNVFTVSETASATFAFSGPASVETFVNHGANLGSQSGQNGSFPRDGVTAAAGESFTLTSSLDSDFTFGTSGNDFFVDYTGPDTGVVEANSSGFVFVSDQAVSNFTVFTQNTTDLDNNFTIGARVVSAVPEPSSAVFLAFAGLVALRRKRS